MIDVKVEVERVVNKFLLNEEYATYIGENNGKNLIIISDYSHMGKTTYSKELYEQLKEMGYTFIDGDYIKPLEYKNIPANMNKIESFDELKEILLKKGKKYIIDTPPLMRMIREEGINKVRDLLKDTRAVSISVGENVYGIYDVFVPSIFQTPTVAKKQFFPKKMKEITKNIAEKLCQQYCENLDDPYIPGDFVDTVLSDTIWEYNSDISESDINDSDVLGYENIMENEETTETFCHSCYANGSMLAYVVKRIYTLCYNGNIFNATMHIDTDVCCVCGTHDEYYPY